jgi:hypothetical protein
VFADIAQQAERVLGKDEVTGSNPVISSSFIPQSFKLCGIFAFWAPYLQNGRLFWYGLNAHIGGLHDSGTE